jgi:hypothetical protein
MIMAWRWTVVMIMRVRLIVAMGVPAVLRMLVMRAAVPMPVFVAVPMAMGMGMIVRMPVMLPEHLLRDRVVLIERGVVTVSVPAAVGARFRLERQRCRFHMRSKALEHSFEHWVSFELQVLGAHLDGRMTIAEVISGAREGQCVRCAHDKHGFICGDDAHESAVIGDEYIAVGQHGTARHDERNGFAVIERCRETALATRFVSER